MVVEDVIVFRFSTPSIIVTLGSEEVRVAVTPDAVILPRF